MTTDLIARQAIITKTREVLALACRLYPDYAQHIQPNISFDLRGRSCGGLATGYRKLTFNLDWYHADPVGYLSTIVPHEVAHIVASATGRGKGHNMGWRRIDRSLGGNGSRCSEGGKAVERARSVTEYLYINSFGREVWIGPVHHKRLQTKGKLTVTFGGTSRYVLKERSGAKITHDGYQGKSRERT